MEGAESVVNRDPFPERRIRGRNGKMKRCGRSACRQRVVDLCSHAQALKVVFKSTVEQPRPDRSDLES